MTTYAYYPGCSLTESAKEFDVSTRLVMERLGADVREIDGWTCCGASAVESVSSTLTHALPARNIALAQRQMPEADILVPCSACYLNHLRVEKDVMPDRATLSGVNDLLGAEGLSLAATGGRVRHILDVLVNDIGVQRLRESITKPLGGVVVAPYYGCQIVRPHADFDNSERPRSMEPLLAALGAEVLQWDMGARCCGASLMATRQDAALVSVGRILDAAHGADVIVTVCPMCQMNLEAYQAQAIRGGHARQGRPVVYLTQLLGLGMGFSEEEMLLGRNMAPKGSYAERAQTPAAGAEDAVEPGNT